MKKAYFIFVVILLVLVVGYLVVRNYMSSEAEEAQKQELKQLVQSELNEYKVTVDSRIDAAEQKLLARIDSLSDLIEEPPGLPAGLDSLLDSTSIDTNNVAAAAVPDSFAKMIDSTKSDTIAVADTIDATIPTEQDNEIYIRYLKKRWALPTDLTKDELAVAKQEIMAEVGKDYGLNAEEVLHVIDKVYAYRKSHKKSK